MRKIKIPKGYKFNKLTVIKEVNPKTKNKRRFLCKCECGQYKEVNLVHIRNRAIKSCGCARYDWHKKHKGENNPNWKGGKRIDDGYVLIYKPDHPRAKPNGYIREHTLVMEEYLGRWLDRGESIHHKNGIRHDNRIENLELWTSSQPSGSRVKDLILYAKHIINQYGENESKY